MAQGEIKIEGEQGTTDEDAVKQVAQRLEFFFSDANVRQDYFMRKQLMKQDGDDDDGDERNVSVESLLKFNTIKKYTTSAQVIVQAAESLSGKLKVNGDKTAISRVTPFTKELMDANIPLTLYLQNLPVEDGRYQVSVDDLRTIFEKYGKIAIIKLKFITGPDKKQKTPLGHALVEFYTQEDCDKAALHTLTFKDGSEQTPKDAVTIKDSTIKVMTLKDYIDQRKSDNKQKKQKEKRKLDHQDDNDTTGQKDGQQSDAHGEGEQDEEDIPKFKFEWKPNCVIELKGLSSSCDRESILDAVAKGLGMTEEQVKGKKIYVDYSRGQTDGAIRFVEPLEDDGIAKLAKNIQDGSIQINGQKVEKAAVLSGDAEQEYWKNFIAFKNKQIRHKHEEKQQSRKKRRRGGRN